MGNITVWHDPTWDRYYLERGDVTEQVGTLAREYIEGLREENRTLRESLEQRELDAVLRENEAEKMLEVLGSCAILLTDREFLHWPELLEETLKDMREWGIEVPE